MTYDRRIIKILKFFHNAKIGERGYCNEKLKIILEILHDKKAKLLKPLVYRCQITISFIDSGVKIDKMDYSISNFLFLLIIKNRCNQAKRKIQRNNDQRNLVHMPRVLSLFFLRHKNICLM